MSKDNNNRNDHHNFFTSQEDLSSLFTTQNSSMNDPTSFVSLSSPFVSYTDFLQAPPMDYGALSRSYDVENDGLLGCAVMQSKPYPVQELVVVTNNCSGNLTPSSGYGAGSGTPVTPNSSVSSSSTEAPGDEELGNLNKDKMKVEDHENHQKIELKESDDQEESDKSKKVNKPRKKGEKRQREPRFAFMTKSEVDHLEDGYRWRKYGQKAVKNSPYPRSYYRCTTQKCSVKKRVERSYQDPTIVITTYEGQHTHPSPAAVRGSSHFFAPSSTSFTPDFLLPQMAPLSSTTNNNNNLQSGNINPSLFMQNLQQLQYADYGLLHNFIHNNQP